MENRYNLSRFVSETVQQERGQGVFELESPHMLEINLAGEVWIKMGAMVAYHGNLQFEREGILEHGLGRLVKRAVTGEATPLVKASGRGKLYCADRAKHVSVLHLNNEALYVNGNDLLAFEPTLDWDIKMLRRITGIMAGGLFAIRLEGTGHVALTSHGRPMTLLCKTQDPLCTDPNATIAWSGHLLPELKTSISFRTFLGRGSGESFQMLFRGDGFVVVQPSEEVVMVKKTS